MNANSRLQLILSRSRAAKFGDVITNEKWPELLDQLINNTVKFDGIIEPLTTSGKLMSFIHFALSQNPSTEILSIIENFFPHLDEKDFSTIIQALKTLAINFPPVQSYIIQMIIRAFSNSSESYCADCLNQILLSSPSQAPIIANNLLKNFPQATCAAPIQFNFLNSTLLLFRSNPSISLQSLTRVIQHLVTLDCMLIETNDSDNEPGALVVDSDIIDLYFPQLRLFLQYLLSPISENAQRSPNFSKDFFAQLLTQFELYILDLPRVTGIQFAFFLSCSTDSSYAQIFIGFLLAKLFNSSDGIHTRSNAALYLSSFLVRASFVSDNLAITTLDYVADFALKYSINVASEAPGLLHRDPSHTIFYYAVQCIAYVLCWRGKNIPNASKRFHIRGLLSSPLGAIESIDRVTYDALRSDEFLGLSDLPESSPSIDRIKVWFPFDITLGELNPFIESIYISWNSSHEDSQNIDDILDQDLFNIGKSRGFSMDDLMNT